MGNERVYVGYFATEEVAERAIAVAHDLFARVGTTFELLERVRQELEAQGVALPEKSKGGRPRASRTLHSHEKKAEGASGEPPKCQYKVSGSFRALLLSPWAAADREPSRAGVTFLKGPPRKYRVRIRGESVGNFDTAEEAAQAYDKRARELGLPMDQLNFPDGDKGNGPRRNSGRDDSLEPDGTSSQAPRRSSLARKSAHARLAGAGRSGDSELATGAAPMDVEILGGKISGEILFEGEAPR
jgi:hypothetical protein